MELVRPLDELNRDDLALAGGKGANLGATAQAGLPVPAGYVVLTSAYRQFVREAGIEGEIDRLTHRADADDQAALDTVCRRIQALFHDGDVPDAAADAIVKAYEQIGGGPVAVRSSATAEDLPHASFAGQQETYLNISGPAQVVDAVRRCWASLWTARALSYRIRNGIDHRQVAIAVVIQQLVCAEQAGVMFTADPVSGHRYRTVIDAAWGLGEAVVSGVVSPDHWTVDTRTGAILEESIATKEIQVVRTENGTAQQPVPLELRQEPTLTGAQIASLVDLGRRTAEFFGEPQDIEWAMAGGHLYLLQSRPITTLFPLPQPAPPPDSGLHLYVTFAGMQGVVEPITPAGISVLRLLFHTASRTLGLKSPGGSEIFTVAAGRFYLDVTGVLQTPLGQRFRTSNLIDAAMTRALRDLHTPAAQSRMGRISGKLPFSVPRVLRLTPRVLVRMARALANPPGARRTARSKAEAHIESLRVESRSLRSIQDRVSFVHRAIGSVIENVVLHTAPLAIGGHLAFRLTRAIIERWGVARDALAPVSRSVPHNPTTEMDLELWQVSRRLAEQNQKPTSDHPVVRTWLARYGHRAVREIDIGVPRWREQPEHIIRLLNNYEQHGAGSDPERHFEAGARSAGEAIDRVVTRVREKKGRTAASVVRFLLSRFRQLAGAREWHKFYVVHVFAIVRDVVKEIGVDLASSGRLNRPDDVFFLELDDVLSSADLRDLSARNRRDYERELARRAIPLAVTSEGEVSYGHRTADEGALAGLGVSPGVHEGVVRVVDDPTTARLEPGEVLVAHGTDPAWTPLFLTAGALVTETGGTISHGAVVAREYGIPAVVGLPQATSRLRSGQRVRVDGTAGTVELLR